MHKLITHNKYLFGLVVVLAVACAWAGQVFPCGFKWG